jgi:trehalose 6-phosphate synthase
MTIGVLPEALPQELQRIFPGRRFVVVSNREPYEHAYDVKTKQIVVRRPAGGLTSALDPLLKATAGDWVAWGSGAADPAVSDAAGRVRVPPNDPSYTLHRVWLDQQDIDEYYLGYANQLLWPLCHLRPALTRIRGRHFERYAAVNEQFASAVVRATADQPAAVWFHDYHLALAPKQLHDKKPNTTSAHFWHIPFPPPEVFRVATRGAFILEGLLANDLVGFHLPSFTANFLRCVQEQVNAEVDWDRRCVHIGDHTCWVRALPISIDVEQFERAAAPPDAALRMRRMRNRFAPNGERIGVGVDRLDYSKGLEEKFKALELLWLRSPEWRETFTYVQVAVPTRTNIGAYDQLNDKIDSMACAINEKFGTRTWTPIQLVKQPMTPARLALLYRISDLCIISSLQDGMNLVAKEYVASQVDNSGVLLLSKFAGAIEEVAGAIPMNPYDPENAAELIRNALEMRAPERADRMKQGRASLRTIYDWLQECFELWGVAAEGGEVPLSGADQWV